MAADYLESALLRAAGFRHAFFTRNGGVSSGPYRSLNFSISVGDSADNVEQNFALAAAVLGVPAANVCFLSQVHGSAALALSEMDVELDSPRAAVAEREGDALVSQVPVLACGVRTADCVPILVADRHSGAVAAIHAGWRGVVRGIIETAVEELTRCAASQPRQPRQPELIAAIGPHIGPSAFEVGEEVAVELERASSAQGVLDRTRGKPRVALRPIVRAKLTALGIADALIDDVEGCTMTESERFFSFRRDGKFSGRHLSAIVPLRRP